jgi:hypothetical protein
LKRNSIYICKCEANVVVNHVTHPETAVDVIKENRSRSVNISQHFACYPLQVRHNAYTQKPSPSFSLLSGLNSDQ